jgi:TonB-dependent SusC/RagA subfamily outer membrane receptor
MRNVIPKEFIERKFDKTVIIFNLYFMKRSSVLTYSFTFFSLLLISFSQPDTGLRNIEKLSNALNFYIDSLHPQKIYLHTDKSKYFAGDRIWFRTYLLDGITHIPDTRSQHVYVELVDPYKRIVQIIRVREYNGRAGDFYLSDTIPEGIYQIRAYTNWMKNFGPEFYYSKKIEVYNAHKQFLITNKEAKKNKKTVKTYNKQQLKYSFGFFPEGGNLLDGVSTCIAFKAENEFGEGIHAEGKIINSRKEIVADFATEYKGMGTFYLTPQSGEKYTALVEFADGHKTKPNFPDVIENAVGISLEDTNDKIYLSIKSNKIPSRDRPANEYVLIGHVRGKIYYAISANILDNDTLIQIEKKDFPSGIVHFTLFNNRFIPVSERLFFINHNDFQNFRIFANAIDDTLKIRFRPAFPLQSSFFSGSMSILISDTSQTKVPSDNIISNLLLTSDLPGYIPDAAYYLTPHDELVKSHTDMLMLTHGWKRYFWPDIIEEKFPRIRYEFEQGVTVKGKITREILEIPISEASVRLYIQSAYNDEFLTYSARNGFFMFNNLNYYDTLDVKIVARKKEGGKNLLIILNEGKPDEVLEQYGDFFLTTTSKIDMKAYRHQQNELAKEEYTRREKELDSIYATTIHGKPDNVLWADDFPPGYSNLLEAMQGRIPGVDITGDRIIIRGVGTFYGSTDPLVLVDGTPTNVEILRNIPVQDVDRVEILKGPSASMYGSRGGNGVIAVYTKRGMFMKKGEIRFSMLGYHVAEKFHLPSSGNIQERINNKKLPLTLYWNPDIKISNNESEISIPVMKKDKAIVIILEGTDQLGKPGFAYALIR